MYILYSRVSSGYGSEPVSQSQNCDHSKNPHHCIWDQFEFTCFLSVLTGLLGRVVSTIISIEIDQLSIMRGHFDQLNRPNRLQLTGLPASGDTGYSDKVSNCLITVTVLWLPNWIFIYLKPRLGSVEIQCRSTQYRGHFLCLYLCRRAISSLINGIVLADTFLNRSDTILLHLIDVDLASHHRM